MARLISGIALLLAYLVTPGAGEMTENLAHYLLDGHAAHAAHDAEQDAQGDAHGCSGPFQTCPCHGTAAFVTDSAPIEVSAAEVDARAFHWFVAELQGDVTPEMLFRPPIA